MPATERPVENHWAGCSHRAIIDVVAKTQKVYRLGCQIMWPSYVHMNVQHKFKTQVWA